ncbi:hypothetical protein ENBRE01_0384 [Enteropsectra breve]|nr:hypothetical protein ENBRE01_0384 [Enteropsectra breve]
MEQQKSSVIIRTSTNKEYKLPHTESIHLLDKIFTIHREHKYLYAFNENEIEIFTLSPFNKTKSVKYPKDVIDLCAVADLMYVLTKDCLYVHGDNVFASAQGDFENAHLVPIYTNISADGIKEQNDLNNMFIGVQGTKQLEIFSKQLQRTRVFKAQASFSVRDVLIIGNLTQLQIYIKNRDPINVMLPEMICAVICDQLFSKIIVATADGSLHCISTEGDKPVPMRYHECPAKYLAISSCGSYLFSADRNRMVVWDLQYLVVVKFHDFENEIRGFKLYLDGDKVYGNLPISLE